MLIILLNGAKKGKAGTESHQIMAKAANSFVPLKLTDNDRVSQQKMNSRCIILCIVLWQILLAEAGSEYSRFHKYFSKHEL